MVLAIAYCHHDSDQALRLVRWIRFLSPNKTRALLVPSRAASRMRRHNDILIEAVKTFTRTYVFVPSCEREEGWPVSANFMFRETLEHCERHFSDDDVFWLEPDAVPVTKNWFESITSDHQAAGKIFTGGAVMCSPPHMTGNGIYGTAWRKNAPRIAESADVPWDVFAGDEIWKNAFITPKIQHCWTRVSGHSIKDLGVVRDGVELFHQDKSGILMRLLDDARFSGKCFRGRQDIIERVRFMRKYYHTDNQTRDVVGLGISFHFEATDSLAGTWRGVYTTENEQELVALDALAGDPATGIREITVEEYDAKVKKNATSFRPLDPVPRVAPPIPGLQEKVGVVVDSPISPKLPVPSSPEALPDNIDDVLETGRVEPQASEPVDKPKTRKRKATQ